MASGPTHGASRKAAWGGRFAQNPDARLEAFNASIGFDARMAREDIRGSIAHARMLGKQGIISTEDAATLERGLWTVYQEVRQGELEFVLSDEDIHTGIERRLRELVGPVAGRLHTARSRNDQVATTTRLWTRGALLDVLNGVLSMRGALIDAARAHQHVTLPGYTHLQRGQPVTLAHHLLAYDAMLSRDADRLRDALRRMDVSPLGAAALAGATYPIDREATAAELGFTSAATNSMDAVSDRDFICDALYACAMIATHLSRFAEDVCLWATAEFRFIQLSDAFSTGSSIMPQKKNPDVAELARGKTGRVFGHLMAMLTVLKGTPMTYNKDFQEDKEGLFDTIDTLLVMLDVLPPMLQTARFNEAKMAEAATADFILATDAADLLARNGVPFREAHEVIGKLVGECVAAGITFADLTDAQWAAAHPIFAEKRPPMTAEESVAARDVLGGTAPRQVALALANATTALEQEQHDLDSARAANDALYREPAGVSS